MMAWLSETGPPVKWGKSASPSPSRLPESTSTLATSSGTAGADQSRSSGYQVVKNWRSSRHSLRQGQWLTFKEVYRYLRNLALRKHCAIVVSLKAGSTIAWMHLTPPCRKHKGATSTHSDSNQLFPSGYERERQGSYHIRYRAVPQTNSTA